eukprot:gb/GFBE01055777.1/.p1 GENE.gb/GFBE01055777.1/~~gb/GFBE01055777.1/.p1  ORF type:complete len:160 (+),score=39.01 gb/GFBE01055777.1/:1-480(+)
MKCLSQVAFAWFLSMVCAYGETLMRKQVDQKDSGAHPRLQQWRQQRRHRNQSRKAVKPKGGALEMQVGSSGELVQDNKQSFEAIITIMQEGGKMSDAQIEFYRKIFDEYDRTPHDGFLNSEELSGFREKLEKIQPPGEIIEGHGGEEMDMVDPDPEDGR